MKKNLLISILCMAILLPGIRALAVNPYEVRYCDQCGASLVWDSGGTSTHETTTHYVPTGYIDADGRPVYADFCTVGHVWTGVSRSCPNGHGVKWSGTCHQEYHSCKICGYVENYE